MRISTLEKKMEHMAAAVNGIILLDWLSAASLFHFDWTSN
jgi:hypothetical protein